MRNAPCRVYRLKPVRFETREAECLQEWFVTPDGEFCRPRGPAGRLLAEINATGAVLAGRRTVEQVDHWGGDHHGVPSSCPATDRPAPRSRTTRW
jgi:hypothetical protein